MSQVDALAAREPINLRGVLTWSIEFEDQPNFAGFREFATMGSISWSENGEMCGKARSARVRVAKKRALTTENHTVNKAQN